MIVALAPIHGCTRLMLLIPCPWCGPRDQSEFDYGGAAIKFPELDDSLPENQNQWHEQIHIRENPRGLHSELWYHAAGCECWIEINRNTLSHELAHEVTHADSAGKIGEEM